ncbi:MAG: glycine cleavage system aminomethyltransferase GcvT [Pelolinea sp.]|nr:glycine cleavage system aminomethyltransferase GcvT [Pelolinea sp.]
MPDFILKDLLSKIDPEVKKIIDLETDRQKRKLILIPSESSSPFAVRESLGSVLQNLYAEGYPPEGTRLFSEEEILDLENQIINYRRYSDPRYYKGVENADLIEELARRRCAELFANDLIDADHIFVNVQPLSGAPANNAVYQALIEPGDVIVGMNLFHGGHLTHGSSVNRSGKLYQVFHYSVDPQTEKINYDAVEELVNEKKPKIIIAGYSSYPWSPDWERFSVIAHSVGAYLLADISHIAGMIAAEALPSPVGFADVITFTTHKTLCGPRGACILSFDSKTSTLIDKAVFPGEQGGPHIHAIAGMATAFKLAKTDKFRKLQQQILVNCSTLSAQLEKRGIKIAFRGTNTHLLNIDCKSISGNDGTTLSGDMAARILDLAGLVANSNTIPGDKSALRPTGVRLGTPWITQRGLVEEDMVEIANIIADILHATTPYTIMGKTRKTNRTKIDFNAFEQSKKRVRTLIEKTVDGKDLTDSVYPFHHYIDDFHNINPEEWITFDITGDNILSTLQWVFTTDLENTSKNEPAPMSISVENKMVSCFIQKQSDNEYKLMLQAKDAGLTASWLQDLSDGFILFDPDPVKTIPGPFILKRSTNNVQIYNTHKEVSPDRTKPFYIGIDTESKNDLSPLNEFVWEHDPIPEIKRTKLFDVHQNAGAKIIPFAGWEMPVWYTSVVNEHKATREAAGLFDVSHMGVFEASGWNASLFLDCVCANNIAGLKTGESCYTHFLDPDANVIDDLLVYRHQPDKYLIVVNAANTEKDWAWLNAVKDGLVKVDNDRPWVKCPGRKVILRNLHDEKEGSGRRVDIALQGPLSQEILLKIGINQQDTQKISNLSRTDLCHVQWGEQDLIVSRTGYTGEKMAFEIFIHPDKTTELWEKLIEIGTPLGLMPCGLGARDSLRTEAGLPLYGHEMGGKLNLGVAEAGFGSFVKLHKPWFIGRSSYIENENKRSSEVIRFCFEEKHTRIAQLGDLVFNDKGKNIGFVTSCAIDKDEFLTGLAFIEKKYSVFETPVFIFQKTENLKNIDFSNIGKGEKITLPSKAIVVKRFPRL